MRHGLRSLRGLTIAFVCLFLAVTLLAGFGTFFTTLSTITKLVDKRIEAGSHAIAPVGVQIGRSELERRLAEMASQRDTGDLGLLLTDIRGRRIAGNVRFTRMAPLGYSSLSRRDRIEGLSAGRVFVRDIGDGMRLAVFAETEPFDDYFAMRQRIYMGGFGAIILVVFAGLLLFRRLVGQRIEQMRLTAQSIIEGDLDRRVPLSGDGGEFDQQAAAFNHMLDRMSLLMAEIRNVSNDISHELRTPLAKLRNELALLQQQQDTQPVRHQLQRASDQADELLAMFTAMLRIAEIESGSRRAGFQPLSLDRLAEEMVEMVLPLAAENDQRLTIARCDSVSMIGDRQLLSQMLINLLENAVRHTPAKTEIQISVEKRDAAFLLTVKDNGPGIDPDQRQLVMRRFGRIERSRPGGGHGLGLPLAEAIARLHHGTMALGDADPGLLITVIIPE